MEYNEIISNLTSDGAGWRCKGIMGCLTAHVFNDEIQKILYELKSDDVIILGRKVGSYAKAALDILGGEAYEGDEEEVLDLIAGLKEIA